MAFAKIRRRFTLVDGMVLVVAVAVSFAVMRNYDQYHGFINVTAIDQSWKPVLPPGQAMMNSVNGAVGLVEFGRSSSFDLRKWVHWAVWSGIALAPLAPAILALNLLPPRPRFRRVFRAPGAVACASVTLALLASLLPHLYSLKLLSRFPSEAVFQWGIFSAHAAGFAVAGAWSGLFLGGRWRADRSWLDRAGRAVGLFWIVVAGLLVLLGF